MVKKKHKINKLEAGFTLIEMLTVISIITYLASILIITAHDARGMAQQRKWQADTAQIQKAYELHYEDHGYYPVANSAIPAAELSEYLQIVPTTFTAGVGSYFALSRSQTDPDVYGYSDDGSACIRIHNGYIIAVGAGFINEFTLNDGGIEPAYYENFGGDFRMFNSGVPGTYPGTVCPEY